MFMIPSLSLFILYLECSDSDRYICVYCCSEKRGFISKGMEME